MRQRRSVRSKALKLNVLPKPQEAVGKDWLPATEVSVSESAQPDAAFPEQYPARLSARPRLPENLPVANRVADSVICLPMYHGLSDEEVSRILSTIMKK